MRRAIGKDPSMAVTVFPEPLVERSVGNRTYWSLAALQVADVATTAYILGALGGEEQNPLARLLTDLGWPGLALLLIVKLGLVLALYRKQTRVRLATVVYSAVLANNLFFLLTQF
jgi:hypothetical protein